MDGRYRRRYLFALFLSAATTGLLLVNPYFSSVLVDTVIVGHNIEPLPRLLLAMVLTEACLQGLRYLMVVCFESSSQNLVCNLRRRLYEKLQHQEMAFFDRNRTGDLMTRLSSDVDWCRHFAAALVYILLECVGRFAFALAFLLFVNARLALTLLAIAPPLLGVTLFYSGRIRPLFQNLRERQSSMNTAAQENIAGSRTVRAFAREEYEKERFAAHNGAFRDANLAINKRWLCYYPAIDFLSNAMTLITIFYGAFLIMQDKLTFGELTIFTSISWMLSGSMSTLGAHLNDLQRFRSSADKVIEIFFAQPTIVDRADAESHPAPRGEIEFRNVNFSYGGEQILRDVSFHVPAGKTLAIMGSTGSGKSTVISLLSRLYDVKDGEVLLDGCSVRRWKLEELRRCIAEATQDVFLFSASVSANIAFGDLALSDEEIADCARRAGAAEFIEKMPEGYDTIVGERGVGLSGGQRQRVALARAMAMRAPVLVLDDTTSALDSETEAYIRAQLRALPYACTKIIIAQRVSSVEDADEILVFDHGRIAERGTHKQLLAQRGYYYRIYCMQNDLPAAEGGEPDATA